MHNFNVHKFESPVILKIQVLKHTILFYFKHRLSLQQTQLFSSHAMYEFETMIKILHIKFLNTLSKFMIINYSF